MPSPDTVLTTQRPDLGTAFMEFDHEANWRGLIAHRVLPIVEVDKQAGQWSKIQLAHLSKPRDTLRAPGAGYSRQTYKFDKAAYVCEEHGAEELIDDSEREMYSSILDADVVGALRARAAVMENAEARAAALIFNEPTWTSNKTTITNEWDDAANAVPITDILTGAIAIFAATGFWPTSLIINRTVFENLKQVAQIIDRSKSQGFMDVRAGEISAAQLAGALGVDEIIIAGAAKNSANEGQAASMAHFWSNEYAMLCRIAKSPDFREVGIGRTFHWGQDGSTPMGTVEQYREEPKRSDVFRVRHQVDEIVTYMAAGHLFENVTT